MRVLVLFDLPVETLEDKKEYRRFRRFLIKKGFVMLQESVYSKIALNQTNVDSIRDAVKQNKPKSGLVSMLAITEKQFQSMECIVGEYKSEVIDSDERLLVL